MTHRLTWVFIAALILLIAGQMLLTESYPAKFFYQQIPGYKGFIGLIGCVGFVLIGKWIGKHFLQRNEEDDHA